MLSFSHERPPAAAKVRVHIPTLSEDGWKSPHTVVQVVNDDMPFLVDSVTAELNRRGHTVHLVIHPIVPVARAAGRLVSIGGHGASLESMMPFEMDAVHDPPALHGTRSAMERGLAGGIG